MPWVSGTDASNWSCDSISWLPAAAMKGICKQCQPRGSVYFTFLDLTAGTPRPVPARPDQHSTPKLLKWPNYIDHMPIPCSDSKFRMVQVCRVAFHISGSYKQRKSQSGFMTANTALAGTTHKTKRSPPAHDITQANAPSSTVAEAGGTTSPNAAHMRHRAASQGVRPQSAPHCCSCRAGWCRR